jgi:hypothetical protein
MGLFGGPGEAARVFNLPTEQLAAQVSAAADVALTTKKESYAALLDALVGPLRVDESEAKKDPRLSPEDEEMVFAQRVRAGVDQLQISLGERWRTYIQGAALWIAGVYGIVLIHASSGSAEDRAEPRFVLAALLLGGPLTWLIRDITAVIERARR